MTEPSEELVDGATTSELDDLLFHAAEARGHDRLSAIAGYPTDDVVVTEALDTAFARSAERLASLAVKVGDGEVDSPASAPPAPTPLAPAPAPALQAPTAESNAPASAPKAPAADAPPDDTSVKREAVARRRRPAPTPGSDLWTRARPQSASRPATPPPLTTSARPVSTTTSARPPKAAARAGAAARPKPAARPATTERRTTAVANRPTGSPTVQPSEKKPVLWLGLGLVAILALVALARFALGDRNELPSVDESSAIVIIDRCGPSSIAGWVTNFEKERRSITVQVGGSSSDEGTTTVIEAGPGETRSLLLPATPVGAANLECWSRVVQSVVP